MKILKVFKLLLVLSLTISLFIPFSPVSASPWHDKDPVLNPATTCTKDPTKEKEDIIIYPGDSSKDNPLKILWLQERQTSIYVAYNYLGDRSGKLISYNVYLNDELKESSTIEMNFTFEGLMTSTSYEIKIEVLFDGVPSGEVVSTVTTWEPSTGDIVSIEDPNIESKIRNYLQIFNRPLQQSDLNLITDIMADRDDNITTLNGLEAATNLDYVNIEGSGISDLTPLSSLNKLDNIHITKSPNLTDVSPLAKRSNLKYLILDGNNITDISSLAGLSDLKIINLSYNPIVKLDTLLTFPSLYKVYLNGITLDDAAKRVVDTLRAEGVTVHAYYETIFKGWNKICGTWYYYYPDIKNIVISGWKLDEGIWYYLSEEIDTYGQMKTGWQHINGKIYYFSSSGAMQTGWIKDGYWYYLSSSGAMKTGWINDNGTWYYLTGSGAMKTGWLNSGSKWYHLQASGAMSVGWKKINNKWYYFYSQGHMAANTVIDGYKVGKDGAWIR
ncbi:leucine-rich repeat domain-containing protein [Bacillus timonensis]|nr:leucine-rich repeat domain-containing protein [Bacillus timonensis]